MPSQMIIRIDSDLKNKVNNFAKNEGKSLSEVVRELLVEYVKNRDIESYIDNLWDRAGDKLRSKGFERKDLKDMVREVRTKKEIT